jgi:hypothetical protein
MLFQAVLVDDFANSGTGLFKAFIPAGTIVDVYAVVSEGNSILFVFWHSSFSRFQKDNIGHFRPA